MTEQDKQLLIKDLSARLPYKTYADIIFDEGSVNRVELNAQYIFDWMTVPSCKDVIIKPYLRSISKLTEEEIFQLGRLMGAASYNMLKGDYSSLKELLEYVHKNHIDLFGLIPKGLAIEITEENNPYK